MMKNRATSRRRRPPPPMITRRCSYSFSSKIRRRRRRRRRRRCRSRRPSMEMKINNSCCLFLKLLPVDIAADIFSRLPIDFVLQCKLVCKTWRDLIADHHHDNSIIEKAAGGFLLRPTTYHDGEPVGGFYYGEYYNDDKQIPCFNLTKKPIIHHEYPFQDSRNWYIVGSCNGLIALCQKLIGDREPETSNGLITQENMYVCNPYTGEYAKLPNPRIDHPHSIHKAYGFGYHPITKEYKVIRIYNQYDLSSTSPSLHVQVYTLGSGTAWRRSIGEIKHKLHRPNTWGNESENNSWGILLNGVLYWLIATRDLIISFDLADEEFRDISTTPEFHGPRVRGNLGVLNGCLCFSTGTDDSTRIWVMNNNDYSWSKKFCISWKYQRGCCFSPYYPLAHPESGKILLHCNFRVFVAYDPETEHIVELKRMDSHVSFAIIPYMKSSVSLKALGEKEAIHVKAEALREN